MNEEFHRQISAAFLRIGAHGGATVSRIGVYNAIVAHCRSYTSIDVRRIKVDGEDSAANYTLRLDGEASMVATDLARILSSLKGGPGSWRSIYVHNESQEQIKIYLNPDRNPFMNKCKADGRKLARALEGLLDGENRGKRVFAKEDGIVECMRMAVARVTPKADDANRLSRIYVYPAAMQKLGVCRSDLMKAYQAQRKAAVEVGEEEWEEVEAGF